MTLAILFALVAFAVIFVDRRAQQRRRAADESMRQHLAGARPWWGRR